MTVVILSDSHGLLDYMYMAVETIRPDAVIHLGDCWRDGVKLQERFPEIPVYHVPGNVDFGCDAPRELHLTLEGHRVMACHGDRYSVKLTLARLEHAAREAGAELALYGHTHQAKLEKREGVTLLNPGSIGSPRQWGDFSYAVAFFHEGKPVTAYLKKIQEY